MEISICLTGAEPRAAARASADTGQRVSSSEPAQSPAEPATPARSRALSDYTPPTSNRGKDRTRNMLIDQQNKVFTCDHPKRDTLAEVFGTHSIDVAKCVVAGKQISSEVQGSMSQDGGICWEMSSMEDICQVDEGYILVLPKKGNVQYANTCKIRSNAEGCDRTTHLCQERTKTMHCVQPGLNSKPDVAAADKIACYIRILEPDEEWWNVI